MGKGGSIRDHRNSGGPRVISRVRGDKGMPIYANQGSKQSVQMLYGNARNPDPN